ncbi:hypothetical protein [Stenomitos frigidus]|uniref:Biotin carboxylase n=1 Tax=Stenomitos frigidus ULC18 TaxID=2107698 RepID=A0A2T1E547_9CYAN|nr:hypothetical protein [Stenomitos frigidus]PSB27867.1 hypothetical protein C7B82_15940 [Stenomitos frigidus ULC18]
MPFRAFATILATGLLWLLTTWSTPPALALTQIRLFDLSYHDCPAELVDEPVRSGVASIFPHCFIVTGKTENKSGKPVVNADIFGRIYDANNDSVMQNRTRLGAIDEVPPGLGTFELRISVPASQPTPLKLEQFKAAGFTGMVRR